MVLVQKWLIFQLVFFSQYRQGKCLLRYSKTKKPFLGYKNKKFKKSKNSHFSKWVNPWFWSKNGHFSNLIFLGNIGKENVFYDILERKNAILGYKNKKFKKSKNSHFCRGVNPWFWCQNGHFTNLFFLNNIGKENVFYHILERKKVILGLLRYSRTKKRDSRL